jgi:hypothetical protein
LYGAIPNPHLFSGQAAILRLATGLLGDGAASSRLFWPVLDRPAGRSARAEGWTSQAAGENARHILLQPPELKGQPPMPLLPLRALGLCAALRSLYRARAEASGL